MIESSSHAVYAMIANSLYDISKDAQANDERAGQE